MSWLEKLRWSEVLWGYLFLAPTIVGLLVFTLGPVLSALGLSFTYWDLLSLPKPAGVANYVRLGTDPIFWKALYNTFYFTVLRVVLAVVLALLLAVILNRTIRGINLFRTLYFLPTVSSWVVVSMLFQWLYNPSIGLINFLLGKLGIRGPAWLIDPAWALPAIVFMTVWKSVGYDVIIFLAGLQAIPMEYYEAARIDGAGAWRQFRHITLPLLSFTTLFVVLTTMIGSFQTFAQAYIMTGGGPQRSTTTLVLYIYQNAFQLWQMGYGSALAYSLFVVILVFTLLQWYTQNRWVYYR